MRYSPAYIKDSKNLNFYKFTSLPRYQPTGSKGLILNRTLIRYPRK
nr:MAG TPA: hypothetical protein [Inoviridae sp.]DAS77271.1 MAG TPA: hypothetical protein [Inoviridae sp.]